MIIKKKKSVSENQCRASKVTFSSLSLHMACASTAVTQSHTSYAAELCHFSLMVILPIFTT